MEKTILHLQKPKWLVGVIAAMTFSAAFAGDGVKIAAPEVPPPFAESGRSLYRPKTEMSADKIVSGSKVLIWSSGVLGNASALSLLIDEQSVASVRIHSSPEAGWNPLTTFTMAFSPVTGVVRTCPFKTTKTTGGTFHQRIFATPDGKATFTVKYEMDDYATLKGPGVYISMPAPVCFSRSITAYDANGRSKRYVLPDTIEKWCDGKPKPWINSFQANDPVRIAFDEEHPARSFALEFEPGTCRSLVLFRASGTLELYFRWHDRCRTEETPITVDFGFSSRGAESPCVVNGVNFTANNDFTVPCYDPNGNYLVNPSLESGARYFHDVPAGRDIYAQIVEGDAHSGRFALHGDCKTFNFPTVTGRDYVFSFWAKSATGKRTGGGVSANTYLWKKVSVAKWWEVGTEWERIEYVVTNWQYRAIAFTLEQCPEVLFDDFQFEEGRKATPYRGNPLGIELKTDAPDDFFAPPRKPFNARLVVRGPSRCRGKIAYSVVDLFGRKTGEGTLPFDLSSGEQLLPAFDEAFFSQKGVYAIRLNVSGEGFLPYFDYVRLARFTYADAPAPNRRLHQLHGITWPTKAQTNDLARIRRQCDALGLQPRSMALSGHAGDFPPELGHAIIAKNASWGFPTMQHLFHQKRMDATGWMQAASATDELVAKVSAIIEDTVREYSEVTEWIGPNEVSGCVHMCQERNWKEYAKLMRAAHDAVHRANPKAVYACYSTCNLGEQVRTEILSFLAAAKEMWPDFRFDTVDVHPYRPHPEFPDYDADWKSLLDGLDALGYGSISVVAAEGGYFLPICCQPWGGVAPWAPTLVKDSYSSQHLPSFDIGWGERVSAAMMLRYNLVSYKYGSRIRCATSWGTHAMDSRNPIARHVTAAAQLELLGRATFVEDVRFAPGARAYVFDDHAGHAVAAFWRFSLAMDYGQEGGGVLELPTEGLSVELFDMMGNPVTGLEGSNVQKLRLPLSNFPMYVRVPRADAERLAAAFRAGGAACRVDGPAKLRLPKNVQAVHSAETPDWDKIAAVPFKGGSAKFAWSEKALVVRWSSEDRKPPVFVFDSLVDERSNAEAGHVGADENDTVYLIRPKKDAPDTFEAFRREAPDHQLTGGVDRGLLPNVVEPAVGIAVETADGRRTFTCVFPGRQLAPALLRAGGRIGFAQDAPGFDDSYVTVEFMK